MNEPMPDKPATDMPAPDKPAADVASFVLRFSQDLWREAGGQPRVRWRGHIRHVQGDAEARFTDFSDAVAFMQRQLAQLTLESVAQDDAQGQAQALSESFQLWEKVTEGYRDVWLGAIRTAVDGTQAMRRQVGQQLERAWPWWPFWPGGATRHLATWTRPPPKRSRARRPRKSWRCSAASTNRWPDWRGACRPWRIGWAASARQALL